MPNLHSKASNVEQKQVCLFNLRIYKFNYELEDIGDFLMNTMECSQ